MFRQILLSLVIIVGGAAAYVLLVPGAPETLASLGVHVPVLAATDAAGPPAATRGGAGRREGPRPGGGSRGARDPVVVTAAVTEAVINDKLTAIGEGAAAHSVTVVSPASGTLRELLVAPGDTVASGAVIGRLDADAEQIAFERASLAAADAEAALTRTSGLAEASAATNVQLAAAQLAASNARLELQNAELALRRRTISSPIGGTVGLFQVSPGNMVTAQTVVTTIEDTEHLLISFWVPERYASAIGAGMQVSTSAVALPGEVLAGEVSAIDNRIDPASRTLQVQARIPNESGKLRPGMSFAVTMSFPGDAFPSVDPLSIQWSSEGAYLWRYAEGKVERLPVRIIQRNSDGILVAGDLQPGDQVVTQGIQQLTAGASVRLLNELLGGAGADPNGKVPL